MACKYIVLSFLFAVCEGTSDSLRLFDTLLHGNHYDKGIRPRPFNRSIHHNGDNEPTHVAIWLKLSQLLEVDEKNQIMTTNVWLRQEWFDNQLTWDPADYGGVSELYIPAESIWIPDIVLYNNADGDYQVTIMTKTIVHHTGLVVWEPPVIYKSSCLIDVAFFPFDEQHCHLKFGAWSYDGGHINLRHRSQVGNDSNLNDVIPNSIDLSNYYESVEWDLIAVPAIRHSIKYDCCVEWYHDVTFNITIRRKTLFYTINLIVPCVSISFLSIMVFYLPSDSAEKVTLCVSILLSLTVFFLLLVEIIPPTSLKVPLMGKYLLFTMVLVTTSIVFTIVILDIHYRGPDTHTMPVWVHKVFTVILPKLLFMNRPRDDSGSIKREDTWLSQKSTVTLLDESNQRMFEQVATTIKQSATVAACTDLVINSRAAEKAMYDVQYIVKYFHQEEQINKAKEEWKFVAMVTDRLMLWLFTISCTFGFIGIILQGPTLYDDHDDGAPLIIRHEPEIML